LNLFGGGGAGLAVKEEELPGHPGQKGTETTIAPLDGRIFHEQPAGNINEQS